MVYERPAMGVQQSPRPSIENVRAVASQNIRLGDANLTNANFSGARLDAAALACTNFKGVYFFGSHIRNARGLTCSQLKEAVVNDETRLPDYLDSCRR